MSWIFQPAGGENGSAAWNANADGTEQRLVHGTTYDVKAGQTIYIRTTIWVNAAYTGAFTVGCEQLDLNGNYISTRTFTFPNSSFAPRDTFITLYGRFTISASNAFSMLPFFAMPANAGPIGTGGITVSDFYMSTTSAGGSEYVGGTLAEVIEIQAQLAEDLTGDNGTEIHPSSIPANSVKLGTHVTEDDGTSIGQLNALNRFNATAGNALSDPFFNDPAGNSWIVTGGSNGLSRTLNGEYSTPCMELAAPATTTTRLYMKSDKDTLPPASFGEKWLIVYRVWHNDPTAPGFQVEASGKTSTLVSAGQEQLQEQSPPINTWTSVAFVANYDAASNNPMQFASFTLAIDVTAGYIYKVESVYAYRIGNPSATGLDYPIGTDLNDGFGESTLNINSNYKGPAIFAGNTFGQPFEHTSFTRAGIGFSSGNTIHVGKAESVAYGAGIDLHTQGSGVTGQTVDFSIHKAAGATGAAYIRNHGGGVQNNDSGAQVWRNHDGTTILGQLLTSERRDFVRYYNNIDVRAPIFYDIDDTNFYSNNAGSSVFNAIYSSTLYNRENAGYFLDLDGISNVNQMNAAGSHRAPIFYDINNTSFYVDPHNVSVLNDARFTIAYCRENLGYYLNLDGTSNVYRIDAASDMRAPIFYDSNDTTYYCNPAGFSTQKSFRANTNAYASSPITGVDTFGFWTYGPYGGGIGMSDGLGDFGMWLTGGAARVLNFGFSTNSGSLSTAFQMAPGSCTMQGSIRGTEFLNKDDTATRFGSNYSVIRGGSPSWLLRDTDGRPAMLHCNSNIFYLLTNNATNDTETWSASFNGQWPLSVNLTNNDISFGGAGSMVGALTQSTSDERLKFKFRKIKKPIEALRLLKGWMYDWRVEKCHSLGYHPEKEWEKGDIGLKAQDVQKVFPQAVSSAPFDMVIKPGEEGKYSRSGDDYLTVKYEKLVPALFAIGNVQQDQIEALELEMKSLKRAMRKILKKLGEV